MSGGAWLLIVRGRNFRERVHPLCDGVTTIGGPDDEIDLGCADRLAIEFRDGLWRASGEAWLLDGAPLLEVPRAGLGLRHGQLLSQGWDTAVRFLIGERDRVLAEERHLQTALEPLSGLLLSRRAFAAELMRLRPPAALLMIDIDLLKQINDQEGMWVGDGVISRIATFLHREIKWPDIAVRYGGEEFVVVLRDTSIERARRRAQRIRAAHEPAMEIEVRESNRSVVDVSVTATVSIGIAMVRGDPNEALREAEDNLGQAKAQGRNRVVG